MAKKDTGAEPKRAARPSREPRPSRSPRTKREPRSPRAERAERVKRRARVVLTVTALLLMVGCASFSTNQVEERFDPETGKRTGIISTKVAANTLFDSKSDLSKFKAMQSEKTQSASVGSLSQEASGTNAVHMLNALAALVAAMPK